MTPEREAEIRAYDTLHVPDPWKAPAYVSELLEALDAALKDRDYFSDKLDAAEGRVAEYQDGCVKAVEVIQVLEGQVAALRETLCEIEITPLVIRATVPPEPHIPYAQQAVNHADSLKCMARAALAALDAKEE